MTFGARWFSSSSGISSLRRCRKRGEGREGEREWGRGKEKGERAGKENSVTRCKKLKTLRLNAEVPFTRCPHFSS